MEHLVLLGFVFVFFAGFCVGWCGRGRDNDQIVAQRVRLLLRETEAEIVADDDPQPLRPMLPAVATRVRRVE